jgi:hypothetical protein
MLRSFRLENHRSFRDEAELSLLSAYGDSSRGKDVPVPIAAIYGANAAGKSNLLDGLRFMCSAVTDSYRIWRPGGGVPRHPYRLDPSSASRSSTFVVEVEVASIRYTYGFVVDDEAVVEEWLYSYPKGKRRKLFERVGMTVSLGESLGTERAKAEVLFELTRPNALFLSLAGQVELAELEPLYRWFSGSVSWAGAARLSTSRDLRWLSQRLLTFLGEDSTRHAAVLAFVRAADVGISELVIEEPKPLPLLGPDEGPLDLRREPEQLKLRHGRKELFSLYDESDGTLAWLNMLPGALTALDAGGLLVVDEIDSSLHPNLTALLVQKFRSPQANPRGAQLLFTTHDATLLGTSLGEEILGRDQVWFVEKDADGASQLYPLSDFKPRSEGENRERRYLGGSYGAVPVLGDVRPERGKLIP